MAERITSAGGNQIEQLTVTFPDLISKEGGILRGPTTINELLAVHQFLRGQESYQIVINPNQIEFQRGDNRFSVGCELYGQANGYVMSWGATVEGETPEADVIEPHLIVPPQTDGVILTVNSPYDYKRPDIAVIGCVDGESGQKIPTCGESEKLGAQIIPGGSGKAYMWQGYDYHTISVGPETILTESGQSTYLSPDNLLNLSRGGIYLLLVRGKMPQYPYIPLREKMPQQPQYPYILLQENWGYFLRGLRGGGQTRGFSFGFDNRTLGGMKGLGTTRSIEPPPSAAANIGYGRHIGKGRITEFEFDWTTATPVFLRIRVNRNMPPLKDTPEWVAWLNSQRKIGAKYSVISCNYCGGQVGNNVAFLENGRLNVICSCPGCGGRSFSVVDYIRTKRE